MTNTLPDSRDDYCIHLRDLVKPLGYAKHQPVYRKFQTFIKLLGNSPNHDDSPYKPDIYTDTTSWVVTDTYVMTRQCAAAFAIWVDPSRGMSMVTALTNAAPEPAPIPYFTAKTCNKRMLAERYNRSISSITTTFERNAKWLVEIGGMEEHVEERDGELWFTEAYASCIAFGGGKVAAQTKAKAMIASFDNQKLSSDHLQKLLK
ncbi:MAG: hypothetical protein ACKO0Z_27115 [Betaproteobacteria bacterium]